MNKRQRNQNRANFRELQLIATEPCYLGGGEYDHNWRTIRDSSGDPDVIGGTFSWTETYCTKCDLQDETGEHEIDYSDYGDY